MKKLVLLLLTLSLLLPVAVNAGSVSSRYDVTFGGFVKYDLGYSTQNNHADATTAYRASSSSRAVLGDEYGNTFQTAGETRFNFLVRGPELWGAKTSAFIEGDFRGVTTGNVYGGFQLRHAFMALKWDSAELMIGQNWQQWGMPYYGAWIGTSNFIQHLRGTRTPQMTFRYFFTKEFNAMVGITSATEWSGSGGVRQYNDDYARSSWPGLQGEIAYWTDRCGKIGPNNLKFALGGYYGKENKINPNAAVAVPGYTDENLDAWIAAFRYSIPIVPEKQGNKAMSVLLNGNFFLGQNVAGNNWLGQTGGTSQGSYLRPDNQGAAPTVFGLFAQASWWITNKVWMNGLYGYLKYNFSSWARGNVDDPGAAAQARRDKINMMQSYAVNILWDANQAVRFGFEWMRMFNTFNGKGRAGANATGPGFADANGTVDQYRVAAWYFF
ncbi:MAG: hypothetical protein ACYDHW_16280 [Syntrophorhabdaceae bacterium]